MIEVVEETKEAVESTENPLQGTPEPVERSSGRDRPNRAREPRVRRKPLGLRNLLELPEGTIPDDEEGYWANASEPNRIDYLEGIGWRKHRGNVRIEMDGTASPGTGAQQGSITTRPGRRGFTDNDTLVLMTMKKDLYNEYDVEEQAALRQREEESLNSMNIHMAYGEIKITLPDGTETIFGPGGKITPGR